MTDYYSMIEHIADKAGVTSDYCITNQGWVKSWSEFDNDEFKLHAEVKWDPNIFEKKSISIVYRGKEVYIRNHTYVKKIPGAWEKKLAKLNQKISDDF